MVLRKLTGMPKRGEAGFTLIELMIVILVILILAGILVPQFGLAQERARKAKCVSNQRNIETAAAMWSTDNQNVIYTGGQMNASTPNYTQLTTTGQPLYALAAMFAEPDDPNAGNAQGQDYWLSQGSLSGTAVPSVPSYGHVACAADQLPDPWVNSYDGALGNVSGINHTRGTSASP